MTTPAAGVGAAVPGRPAPDAEADPTETAEPSWADEGDDLARPRRRGRRDRLRASSRDDRLWWLGLLGVALLVGGSGWYQMWVGPPYRYVDEQAHAGYVLAIQAGELPTIDTPIRVADGGPALRARLDREPERRRDVWVANNPPLPYVVAAVPGALTRALGLPGGPLLGLRALSVLGTMAAAVYLARLAASLTGGDRRIALVAAGLFAASPHLGFVSGLGFTDGPALLCSMAMLHALVELLRRGPTNRQVAVLSAWCALGSAVRPMTAALAAAVMVMTFGALVLRRVPWRTLVRSSLVLGLPTVAVSGWWYARNYRLYGDATGSEHLLEKFARTPRQGPLRMLDQAPSVWRENLRTLFFRRLENWLPGDLNSWWVPLRWALIAVLVVTFLLVVKDQFTARGTGRPPRSTGEGWLAMVGVTLVVIAMIAQHWSGGGTPHARYAFPAFGVLCAAIALVAVRLGTRWLGLALICGLFAIQVRRIPPSTAWVNAHPAVPFDLQLVDAIGPTWWRLAGGGAMVLGLAAVVLAGALLSSTPTPDRDDDPAPG